MASYDLTNQKFGKLTALKKVGRHGSNALWECLCDCGNITTTMATSLKLGNTKSCGCLAKETQYNRRENFVGNTYGSVTVLKDIGMKGKKRHIIGECACGVIKEFDATALKYGDIVSCGCVGLKNRTAASKTHGLSYNPLYFVWYSMMTRCYNPNFQDYYNYGGRGIRVCDEWFDMVKFINDVTDGYFKGLQLDRIDNDGNYSKSNCRWVTRKQNNRNKRTNVLLTFNNRTLTIVEWCEIYNLPQSPVRERLKKGYTPYEVLFGKIKHEPSKMLPFLLR